MSMGLLPASSLQRDIQKASDKHFSRLRLRLVPAMRNLAGLFLPSGLVLGQVWRIFFRFAPDNTAAFVADFGLCFAQSINDWIRGILPRGQPRLKSRNFAFFGINRNGPGRAKAPIFTPHFFRKTTCLFYKNITRQNSRRLCHFLFSNLFSIFLRKST